MIPGNIQHQPTLFTYPVQAAFGRVLPKNKIYERSGANTRLKDLFVEQVEHITWQYKLAPETINLHARPGVPEIQIFSIQLKSDKLHEDVLRCIDNAVQFPILFEVTKGLGASAQTQLMAAYKRPSEADSHRWVLSSYFATAWMPTGATRTSLPVALDMANLYAALLQNIVPMPARAQETMSDWIARVELALSKHREIEKVKSRLAKEKQFNRKVEINAILRTLQSELEVISH